MDNKKCARRLLGGSALALIIGLSSIPDPSWASPPPHAPAHGWRQKHDPYYLGYTGKRWERDYGVLDGRCNRQAIGGVLGGAVGAAVGSQVGDGSGRMIAILAGTVLGAVLGQELGRRMDAADQACIAHGLELLPDGQRMRWDSPEHGLDYTLTPRGPYRGGRECREFTLDVGGAWSGSQRAVGCRTGDGTWELRPL